MKEIIGTIIGIVSIFIALNLVIKEERKMHDNYLKNELEKTKMIIEELKK